MGEWTQGALYLKQRRCHLVSQKSFASLDGTYAELTDYARFLLATF